ncbi:hypothetical protein [Acinetobacter rudis]|uniref:hypothetical protein n=1 Tax=Acinetobacter rudis TaxID=632955 RepID=UPI003341CDC9
MKANEFVKKFGWEDAKGLLCRLLELGVSDDMKFTATNNMWHRGADGFTWSELKRLVESHELVESFNGLENAKQFLDENIECSDSQKLKQAIADVEACQ